jgi:hypothetical protein
MRSLVKYLALTFLLIAGTARPALGQTHYYVAGGVCLPDHESMSFTGESGWNAGLGLERSIARPAEWLVEASFARIPASIGSYLSGTSTIGDLSRPFRFSGPAAQITTLAFGLRLHGPHSRVQNYAEALVGVANVHTPPDAQALPPGGMHAVRDESNVMLGIGTGLRMLPFASAGIFADVHYQFFLSNAGAPVIPFRIGLVSR